MNSELSPAAKTQIRRQLGARLRQLRRERQLTGVELATMTGVGRSSISRIEHGRIAPSPEITKQLIAAMDPNPITERELMTLARSLDPHDLERGSSGDYSELTQQRVADLERNASEIRILAMNCVPALLQTPEYAASVIDRLANVGLLVHGADPVQAGVIRARRQAELLDLDKKFLFVVSEAALRRSYLDSRGTTSQLEVMMARIRAENVDLRILPVTAEVHGAALTSFMVLDDRNVVYEAPNGIVEVSVPSSVERYKACLTDVVAQALSASESLSTLSAIRNGLAKGQSESDVHERYSRLDLREPVSD